MCLALALSLGLPGSPSLWAKESERHGHDFSDVEKWVQRFENPERDRWQRPDEVVAFLGVKTGDVVADIGAGTGYFARRFARAVGQGGKVLALDVEPAMVAYMAKRAEEEGLPQLVARTVAPDDPGLAPASVDLAFICNTLHHIEARGPYYARLARGLRPGGRLVVVDFYPDREIPVGPPREMRLDPDLVVSELEEAGFVAKVHHFLPYQYVVVARPAGSSPASIP